LFLGMHSLQNEWISREGGHMLSLTRYRGCCMMKCAVYLSITEGSVPPSATERGVKTGE
jgi:hypothetical protein